MWSRSQVWGMYWYSGQCAQGGAAALGQAGPEPLLGNEEAGWDGVGGMRGWAK